MAYTNPWTNILPLGTQQANTTDDEFRKVRLDLFERISSILDPDSSFDDDPLRLSSAAVQIALPGTLQNEVSYNIPPAGFNVNGSAALATDGGNILFGTSATGIALAPVNIVTRCTITKVRGVCISNSGTLEFKLSYMNESGAVIDVITFTPGVATVAIQIAESPDLVHVLNGDRAHFITVTAGGGFGGTLYQVQIKYRFV